MIKTGQNGLVCWTEEEIVKRESLANELLADVKKILFEINPAIQIFRVETPCMMPQDWAKGHLPFYLIDKRYALRGESTKGTYFVMDKKQYKLPICLYQINKSFRDETNNSIRASAYRFREFWQMEFQLFYSSGSKADYHTLFVGKIKENIADSGVKWGIPVELEKNDLPPYSGKTTDLELGGVEVASLSTRKDYKAPVFEISFGLDRLVLLK
jgi:hypothetical protein